MLERTQVLAELESGYDGLSATEARRRLAAYGRNELTVKERPGPLQILLQQIKSPLIYILAGSAVVSAFLGEVIATIIIAVVVAVNTIIGFIQEYKAEETLHALASMTAPTARVVRDGEEREINAAEVVPGDIVLLRAGGKVPADLRLLRGVELEIDESTLTGESLPVTKRVEAVPDPNAPPGDRVDMAFLGTTVARGRGAGVTVATGDRTVFGRISAEVQRVGEVSSPLQVRLQRFAQVIALIVLGATALIVALGVLTGRDLGSVLLIAVSTAVATVPEGLPATVTVALASGVYRMAAREALIRKLPAVEALGSTTVICSDKTGTLTKNEMTTRRIHVGGNVFEVTGLGYAPEGEIRLAGKPVNLAEQPGLELALRIGMLCNGSSVYEENGRYRIDGDPTEAALIVAAMKGGLRYEAEQEEYPVIDEIPFESDRQYMATLNAYGDERFVFVKGAPERILAMSTSAYVPAAVPAMELAGAAGPAPAPYETLYPQEAGPLNRQAVRQAGTRLAEGGLRVLAMAYKVAPMGLNSLDGYDMEAGLVFVGLQGLLDPPRPEAIESVAQAQRAGIRIKMITGDHRVTAEAIARRLGIARGRDSAPLDGRELEALSDLQLFERVQRVSVFARAAPEQKLRVVRELRRHGEVVAVTGDGVNDAPALKQADIGVAMGLVGTDVAKEASDMVITDDNFSTIYAAIEEGRAVFDNIEKVIAFLIPTGLGLVLTVAAAIALGLPLPFLPAQAIWINLVTNSLQDVALAFEPAAPDIGKRPPRDPQVGLLSPLMIQRAVLVGAVLAAGTIGTFGWQLSRGAGVTQARTVAMTTMVLFQNLHIFNSRSFLRSAFALNPLSNPFLLASIVGALGLHVLAVYLAPFQFFLNTVPLAGETWLIILGVASTVLIAVEIDKAIRRARRWGAG